MKMIKKFNCIDNDLRHLKYIFEHLLIIEKNRINFIILKCTVFQKKIEVDIVLYKLIIYFME